MTGLIVKDFLVMRKSIKTYILFLLFYFVMAALGIFPISFITAMVQIIIMMLPLPSPTMSCPSGTGTPSLCL